MKTITLADGTEVPATEYHVYRDQLGVLRQDYERNVPNEAVNDHEDMNELERSIQRLRLLQQQHDLMRQSRPAELELQIQALTVELNVLRAKYGVT
jgi:hypothetical protein